MINNPLNSRETMAEKDLEASDIERKVHNLAEAMSRVRSAQADREDVVVDMKHAKFSRLELLAEEVAPIFDDVPEDNEQFEFAITKGETPRLWIDMTSFVRMAADGREYEFVKDTRLGRTVLGRSSNREIIAEAITDYVAERVLERERMIEGDWISAKAQRSASDLETQEGDQAAYGVTDEGSDENAAIQSNRWTSALTWFLAGVALCLALVLLAVTFDQVASIQDFLRSFTG